MFEFPIGFIQFSPLEIFLHCHIGEGHEYLEFLAYFPELKKLKVQATFSPQLKPNCAQNLLS